MEGHSGLQSHPFKILLIDQLAESELWSWRPVVLRLQRKVQVSWWWLCRIVVHIVAPGARIVPTATVSTALTRRLGARTARPSAPGPGKTWWFSTSPKLIVHSGVRLPNALTALTVTATTALKRLAPQRRRRRSVLGGRSDRLPPGLRTTMSSLTRRSLRIRRRRRRRRGLGGNSGCLKTRRRRGSHSGSSGASRMCRTLNVQ